MSLTNTKELIKTEYARHIFAIKKFKKYDALISLCRIKVATNVNDKLLDITTIFESIKSFPNNFITITIIIQPKHKL